jgi:hypothetical protein
LPQPLGCTSAASTANATAAVTAAASTAAAAAAAATAQATRARGHSLSKSTRAQPKPRGRSPSLRGCSSSHEGTAQVCEAAAQATRAQPILVCEGTAQATRVQPQTAWAQPKPQGHSPSLRGRSPSHEGSAHLSLQGRSPSHSFPHITKIQLNVVVIVDLLLNFLATPPGQTSCARGSIGRPHPRLDVRPPQLTAVATATAAIFVLAVVTMSNFSPSQCMHRLARATDTISSLEAAVGEAATLVR